MWLENKDRGFEEIVSTNGSISIANQETWII